MVTEDFNAKHNNSIITLRHFDSNDDVTAVHKTIGLHFCKFIILIHYMANNVQEILPKFTFSVLCKKKKGMK